jgi:hypothetical protein
MTLADAAETVLKQAGGGPLHCKVISERVVEQGLAEPKSDEPWLYVRAAIRKDNKSRASRGIDPRFVPAGSGEFKLK